MRVVGHRLSGMVTFHTETARERRWLEKHAAAEPWQWRGGELVVDARCAGPLAQAAADAGLLKAEPTSS